MATIIPQYPHTLYALIAPEATRDENGSWVTWPAEWQMIGACREETNGKGSTVTTADGNAFVFTALIQLPVGTPRVEEGTEVAVADTKLTEEEVASLADNLEELRREGKVRVAGTCAKFDKGRLHCRLWV